MFKKVLNLIFNELKLGKVNFGDCEISKIDEYYRIKFEDKSKNLVMMDFTDSDEVAVCNAGEDHYITISVNYRKFYKEIQEDSCFKLELRNKTVEALIENKIKFFIMTKSGEYVLQLDYRDEAMMVPNLDSGYLGFYADKMKFEVKIPKDSEIRIYV